MLYAILIAMIAILAAVVYMKETFVLKYGNPFNDENIVSFNENEKGTRLFGITPDTCPCDKPDYDAGLCYQRCEDGYHGVATMCVADTENIGIGKVLLLKSCEESGYGGYTDMGLTCSKWEPNCNHWTSWGSVNCTRGRSFRIQGYDDCYEWWTGCVKTGAKKLSCDGYDGSHPDEIASLCYKKCPPGMRHVPGMPYLCFKGSRGLTYDRGVGVIPKIMSFGDCGQT